MAPAPSRNSQPSRLAGRCVSSLPFLAAVALVFLLGLPVAAQRGAIVLPQNLAELVDQSAVIVRGQVIGARVEPHPELKGLSGATFTFRQFIWDMRDRFDAAGYRKGDYLLLLMIPPSAYGLSSPAGLEQGRFRVVRDAAGKLAAVNGHGNADLFHELAPALKTRGVKLSPRLAGLVAQPQAGAIALDDLRELIRQIAGAN